jgi:hypothetical protein
VPAVDCSAMPEAEKYLPWLDQWVSAGDTPTTLPQSCPKIVAEIGPAVLLPNGRVLLTASPSSPCDFPGPTSFFEYDPATNALTAVAAPSNNGGPCFTGRFLLAPNAQVLFRNPSDTVTAYTRIHPGRCARSRLEAGDHRCAGGDGSRLERDTNVSYCRTADHSTMAIATGTATVSTVLSIPASVPPASYRLVVVANGIPSDPVDVEIVARRPELKVELESGV